MPTRHDELKRQDDIFNSPFKSSNSPSKAEIEDAPYDGIADYCLACSGSGEGSYDGSICPKCHGSGHEPVQQEERDWG